MKMSASRNSGHPISRLNQSSSTALAEIETALEGAGLIVLGAFHPGLEDSVPALSGERGTATIVLAGNGGGSMWPFFKDHAHRGEHPLNQWSVKYFERLATQFGACAVSPADGPPFHPFQRWALRGGQAFASPIGILIHPEYGLWHSYRGALIFADRLELPATVAPLNPCDSCTEKPCLSACPADAFQPDIYDVKRCAGHISRTQPNDCLTLGCGARHACPIGQKYAYPPAQAQFHMAAFVNKHGGRQ